MPTIRQLALNEGKEKRFLSGHGLCQGCGIPIVVRTVLNSIETPVAVVNATGCLEVATTRFPNSAWNVPWLHVAFENVAAAASGVEAAYRTLKRRGELPSDGPLTIVAFGGDGGTYDIGLQSLSGALERGHRFLYVCYDNQAYMNTGIQRSGATPFGANTTTSPAGTESFGKAQKRKDLTAIVAAHHIRYVAQASISHWHDLSEKVSHAVSCEGPSFLNVLSTCQLGWRHATKDTVRIARMAVDTRYWPLYEIVDGYYRLTHEPPHPLPVKEWLAAQGRFAHLFSEGNSEHLAEIQRQVDEDWMHISRRSREDAAYFTAALPSNGASSAAATGSPRGAIAVND
ncbi:MAG TPA: thiamine pyrophosphate-dependent enzyme [Spirochaetia bacterium]|nr:thiamine pyrophosphate-dependent enzyme [Spirochaetia bacterium]